MAFSLGSLLPAPARDGDLPRVGAALTASLSMRVNAGRAGAWTAVAGWPRPAAGLPGPY